MGTGREIRVEPEQMLASSKAVGRQLDSLPQYAEVNRAAGPQASVAEDFKRQLVMLAENLGQRTYITRLQVERTSRALALALADHVAATGQVSDDIQALIADLESRAGDGSLHSSQSGAAAGAVAGAATGTTAGTIG